MKKYRYKILFILISLLLAIFLALKFGSVTLDLFNIENGNMKTIFNLRMVRIVIAALAGSSLALSGLLYQSILINPLAEPYLLGVSAGGALGAVLAISFGINNIFFFAVAGSILALLSVVSFANKKGHFDNTGLILSGVMINAFCSALIMLVIALAGTKINSMMFWLMGDIGSAEFEAVWTIIPVYFLLVVVSIVFSRSLDALSFGDEGAQYLGIDVKYLKLMIFILSSLLTGVIVATVGIIGFVGLVIPHIAKMLVGEHLIKTIPFALILGAAFMIIADLVSRTLITDTVLPIGVITALIGVPFFVMVYKRYY